MNVDSNHHKSIEFSDSICTCKECDHKMSRVCFKLHCDCCKKEDHTMVMNGFEAFEVTSKNNIKNLNGDKVTGIDIK